jgi:hypothetical protein
MKLEDISTRIEELILKGKQVLASKFYDVDHHENIDSSKFAGLKTATLSLILMIYDKSHPYYQEIERIKYYYYPSSAEAVLNVLDSLKEEVNGGWLFTTKGIVSAEIFADFLSMAEHLLIENYKDPAAVMIGSVLEEHLRQLCQKYNIAIDILKDEKSIPKKADLLNSELTHNEVYNKLDQKNVTAWLELRNKAAHGKYNDYTKEQVSNMLQGVIEFMTRNSL